jgi:hypothetical protein
MSRESYRARQTWEKLNGPIPDGFWIDHFDGNQDNNSPENLRLATPTQNQGNLKRRKNNSSGFRGVSYHKITGKWKAQLYTKYKFYYLGLYDTPEEASEAYLKKAKEYFGEYFNDRSPCP